MTRNYCCTYDNNVAVVAPTVVAPTAPPTAVRLRLPAAAAAVSAATATYTLATRIVGLYSRLSGPKSVMTGTGH